MNLHIGQKATRNYTMFNRQFNINTKMQNAMSDLEKQADTNLQIAQQCEHDFRTIHQHVFPAVIMIGNQDPSLIEKQIELFSSEKFLGGTNQLVIESILHGLKSMIPLNPSFRSLIEQKSRQPIEQLLKKLVGITDEKWKNISQMAESILKDLNVNLSLVKEQVHISPKKPYDHFEAFASYLNEAKSDVYYIDSYVGDDIEVFLVFLRKIDWSNKTLKILTREDKNLTVKKALESALLNFKEQGNKVELHYDKNSPKQFHDRWLMIDNTYIFKIGASLKWVSTAKSNKSFGIELLKEPALSKARSDVNEWWRTSDVIL